MKVISKIIPVVFALLLAMGWFTAITGLARSSTSVSEVVGAAEESVAQGLYDQAIEQYARALSIEPSADLYQRISDVYEQYYAEEPKDDIRSRYVSALEEAANAYPAQTQFWEKACGLLMESEEFSSAYRLLQRASTMGVSSPALDEDVEKLSYATTLGTRLFFNVKNSLNGCMVVDTGSEYQVLDDAGKKIFDGYNLIGYINSDGYGIYVNDIDTRLIDSDGIARGRYDMKVKDAGEVDMDTALVPVLLDKKWRYLDAVSGEFVGGEYDEASCFALGKAAVRDGESWYLVNASGEKVSDDLEDVKLDLHGCWIHSGVVLAKVGGSYSLYDENLSKIGSFTCDDIDVYASEGSPIAFEQDGKWGFVSPEGEVVHEPEYDCAKSFANGMAAVREKGAVWGYLNEAYRVAIECQYKDALYYSSNRTTLVSEGDDAYQILSFVY